MLIYVHLSERSLLQIFFCFPFTSQHQLFLFVCLCQPSDATIFKPISTQVTALSDFLAVQTQKKSHVGFFGAIIYSCCSLKGWRWHLYCLAGISFQNGKYILWFFFKKCLFKHKPLKYFHSKLSQPGKRVQVRLHRVS